MFEMVTGTVPFDGDNTVSIALAHLEQAVTPPSQLNPEVPVSLDRIIMKCTQKKPEKRYSDVYELIADLRHALVDPDDDFVTEEPEVDTSPYNGDFKRRVEPDQAGQKYRACSDERTKLRHAGDHPKQRDSSEKRQ